MAYEGDVTYPPSTLDGCWATWQESQQDNVVRNTMDKGNVRVRRRFTGINRTVAVSVRLPAEKYLSFMAWYNDGQKQGVVPTYCKTPYGTEELFLWTSPPTISWPSVEVFEASVTMYQGSNWRDT